MSIAKIKLTASQKRKVYQEIEFKASTNTSFSLGYFCSKNLKLSLDPNISKSLDNLNEDFEDIVNNVDKIVAELEIEAKKNTLDFISYRKVFKEVIIGINELMNQLPTPGYIEDEAQDIKNRDNLNFYEQLGNDSQ